MSLNMYSYLYHMINLGQRNTHHRVRGLHVNGLASINHVH